jgi:phosphotransferase system enzyme I (PtsI)
MTGAPEARRAGAAGTGPTPARPRAAPRPPTPPMRRLRGLAVSSGVAIGPALVLDPGGLRLPPRALAAEAIPAELARLDAALAAAHAAIESSEADARTRLGPQYAAILAAHARMVADPTLRRDAARLVQDHHIAAEHAVRAVLDTLAARLEAIANAHLAARAADVRDVERRILASLAGPTGAAGPDDPNPTAPGILLAHDLAPSQAARLDPSRVLGFATEGGGQSSHTAIVAAGLRIPAVVGLGPMLEAARTARTAILDGDEGLVVLDPDAATLRRYRAAARRRAARRAGLSRLVGRPALTRDGARVELLGNIEFPAEVELCTRCGADGVGLFRTEFLYLNADPSPSEDEQFAAYALVVRALGGRPVTIRTLDLGADKLPSGCNHPAEPNPSLGLRSLRLSLRDPALFRTQLRAILRAAALGDVRVLFPLVTTLDELRCARALLGEVARELADEGGPTPSRLPVGAMIEVPAAALMADRLAKEVDFLSIGTNDLIQYTLAVDRANEAVAPLYTAADPAVLRLILRVVEAARARQVPVNVCGTMGGEPLYGPLLLGLGLRQLSMPPGQLLEIKRVVRATRVDRAEALAREVLELDTAETVLRRLRVATTGNRRAQGPPPD